MHQLLSIFKRYVKKQDFPDKEDEINDAQIQVTGRIGVSNDL